MTIIDALLVGDESAFTAIFCITISIVSIIGLIYIKWIDWKNDDKL